MLKFFLFLFVLLAFSHTLKAQHHTDNLVIVTLDGMRWQEVFGGVEYGLMANRQFTSDSSYVANTFYNTDPEVSRKKLFPFLWSVVNDYGQVYGNRSIGSLVNVANPYKFSYPGYNEIFTGFPDPAVNSNDKVLNKNENVLEFISRQKNFKGKVAAFTSWDVFPYILNKWRSGIYVNADDTIHSDIPQLKLINDMQLLATRPLDVRQDLLTYFAAREYLKSAHPRVLYIGLDETDDYAHKGRYDDYLRSAHAEDAMLADIWNIIQSIPAYSNHTTLIVTCDHGRGRKSEWTSHGEKIEGAEEIWFAVIGPDIKSKGEMEKNGTIYQGQFAATFAALLGLKFKADHPVMSKIDQVAGY